MAVKSDRWIRKMALERRRIEPFNERRARGGVVSSRFEIRQFFPGIELR